MVEEEHKEVSKQLEEHSLAKHVEGWIRYSIWYGSLKSRVISVLNTSSTYEY